jgi:hypothetical protein
MKKGIDAHNVSNETMKPTLIFRTLDMRFLLVILPMLMCHIQGPSKQSDTVLKDGRQATPDERALGCPVVDLGKPLLVAAFRGCSQHPVILTRQYDTLGRVGSVPE